jgi:hypothetical protein
MLLPVARAPAITTQVTAETRQVGGIGYAQCRQASVEEIVEHFGQGADALGAPGNVDGAPNSGFDRMS